MANDYSDIGLNQYLQPGTAPVSEDRGFVSAYERDLSYETSPYLAPTTIVPGAITTRQTITLTAGGAEGGGPTSFFTDSSTPQGIDSSRLILDPEEYPGGKFYLEVIYRAGTSGEAARTFFADVYDITGGSAVANGTVTGTAQSGSGYGVFPRARSTVDFRTSMVPGTREYMVRYWGTSTPGTLFVDLYAARIIVDVV